MDHLYCAHIFLITLAVSSSLSDPFIGCGKRHMESKIEDINPCFSTHLDEASQQIQRIFTEMRDGNCELANPKDYPAHFELTEVSEFDFIVVGAGSAGSVVANRLSENPRWNILLLEAGDNPTKTSEVPALFSYLQKSEIDWQYKTDPDENNCLGMKEKMCNLPAGKVLGGSSTINYMMYVRGSKADYDEWAADGNIGWAYHDVLPYFKKSEDLRAKEVPESPYHNRGGPLKVETWKSDNVKPVSDAFEAAMNNLGYPLNLDVNGQSQKGYVKLQGTLENGKRCSTAKAYLAPISQRKNLKVSKQTLVTKILINDNNTAYGVQCINRHGETLTILAKKEVILSAGAIRSPQLLMLSGVGPRRQLDKLSIPVVQDLPVGANLQDHPLMISVLITLDFNISSESSGESMFKFLTQNNSMYSQSGMGSYAAFIDSMTKEKEYADLEIIFTDYAKNDPSFSKFLEIIGIRDEIKNEYLEINKNSYTIFPLGSLLKPYSRGVLELQNTDPRKNPKITAGYFLNETDILTYFKMYEFLDKLVETESLKNMNAKIHEIKIPGCMQHPVATKMYRECALRHLTTTTYHLSGTCKMGPAHSPGSVVDAQLRVKGVHRLRVVDASVMPKIPRGNINAPVIMVAEKGSDLIKTSWLSGVN